jgi:inorganic pyrophosphatase
MKGQARSGKPGQSAPRGAGRWLIKPVWGPAAGFPAKAHSRLPLSLFSGLRLITLVCMGSKLRVAKVGIKKNRPQQAKVEPVNTTNNPYHVLSPGPSIPEMCHAYIECPMRSKIKYELEKKSGFLQISRMLHSAVHYPSNYGFIPQTYCQDHDPLDILVLSQEPVVPGCVMKARPIGMLRMIDQHEEDIKIIAAHADDPMFSNYNDISQLPPHVLLEIRHFFEIYKELEKADLPEVEEFQGRVDAYRAIRSALALYQRHLPQLLKGEYPDI